MYALRELQKCFGAALLHGADAALAEQLIDDGLTGVQRFDVYRNNVREGFTAALADTYPVLRRLVGEDYFRQLAREYQLMHPSPSGNLYHVGQRLPGYLGARFAGTDYDYFTDIAQLEWLCQEVLCAATAEPLSIERLATISQVEYPRVRLLLHPALRLLQSRYPIMQIWQENQPDTATGNTIDLQQGVDRVVVRRAPDGLELRRLSAGEFALLRALADGKHLTLALQTALLAEPDLPFTERLPDWARLGIITDFSLN